MSPFAKSKPIVIPTPSTGPPLKEVWVFVSRSRDGKENVIGGAIPPAFVMTPMITGNPDTLRLMEKMVAEAREELEAHGQTTHLLHFTQREEIPW